MHRTNPFISAFIFHRTYSAFKKGDRSYHYVHESRGRRFSFISVDACPDPAPRRPFNFFGILSQVSLNLSLVWGLYSLRWGSTLSDGAILFQVGLILQHFYCGICNFLLNDWSLNSLLGSKIILEPQNLEVRVGGGSPWIQRGETRGIKHNEQTYYPQKAIFRWPSFNTETVSYHY